MRAPVRFGGCSCCCRGEKRCACVRGCVHARAKPSKPHKCAAHRFTPSRAPTADVATAAGCVACAQADMAANMCRSTIRRARAEYNIQPLHGHPRTQWREHTLAKKALAIRCQVRSRCGPVAAAVPAQMWVRPGADVGESRRRCGRVPAQMWVGPGADVGPVPAQMWAQSRRRCGPNLIACGFTADGCLRGRVPWKRQH